MSTLYRLLNVIHKGFNSVMCRSFVLFSNLAGALSVFSVLVYQTSLCLPEKCQSIGDMKFVYFALLPLWSDVF